MTTKPATKQAAITSPDLGQERLAQLKRLMPDLFDGEGNLDEAALRALAAPEGASSPERFRFEWAGKQQSKRQAFTPSKATLVADSARSVKFDTTQNLIIEGDNLEVLKLLQTTYFERVKCIYIDPPYNKDADVLYPDDYSESKKAYWQRNGTVKDGVKLTALPESHGRKHSLWLNMMQSRLLIARQLLCSNGVIIIHIDDVELPNLKKLCDEIFGEENFIGQIVWKNATDNNPSNIAVEHEYIMFYAKNKGVLEPVWKASESPAKAELIKIGIEIGKSFKTVQKMQDAYDEWFKENKAFLGVLDRYKYIDEDGVYTGSQSVHNPGKEGYRYDVVHPKTGKPCKQPLMGYRFPKETMDQLLSEEKILFGDDETKIIELKVYAKDYQSKLSSFINLDGRTGAYDVKGLFPEHKQVFRNPKPVSLVKEILDFVTNKNDKILDFFAGSGTTAHAMMQLNAQDGGNRKYILVQIPEYTDENSEAYKAGYKTISSLCIERVKRAGAKIRKENPDAAVDTGFRVYRLTDSNFPQNLYTADPEKSEAENLAALKAHLQAELPLASDGAFADIVTEIALKNGYGLFYTLEKQPAFKANTVYRLHGNDKSALLCLDTTIADATVEALEPQSDNQLILSRHALDTAKKWVLQQAFKDNLHTV